MVRNCRAEISPRPVSQDVHLCTTFYLYRLNYVAHTLQILCFCQQLVYFWGDKSRTDDKQPLSVSVDSVRLDTLQIVIAHTIDSRVTSPTGQFQTGRIWIMISFYSLTAVKKLGTLRVIGLCTSIAFVLASLSLLSSPLPSDPRKTNHNFCYCLALRACISPHSVRTARLREDSQRVFHRPPGYRFRYFAALDGISRPPFCITTDLFAE